jgi:CelD/BcsL family acetyltransferase involved in cellulose biosynthesis
MTSSVGAAAKACYVSSTSLSVNPDCPATNVYEIDPFCDARWEALTHTDPRASVFHTVNWLRALQTTYGYEPLVVTTCPPSAALTNGLVFCRVESWLTGRRLVSLPFADHCEPLVSDSGELENLLLHMRQRVDADKWKYIEIRAVDCQPRSQTGLSRSATYSFHRLDLRKNTNELFHGFHKNCIQRKIRRAEREKLRYEEGTSETLLQNFYELLIITRRRQRLPAQPLSWFRALIAVFGEDLKIRVATKDGVPVASIVTLTHKKSMVYKYGCSDARFHRLGGVAFLFWNAIQDGRDKGCEEFEMGRSDNSDVGLITFKERWGAARTELSYWTYPQRSPLNLNGQQMAILRRMILHTPTSALKIAGKFFYRHAG